MFVAARSSRIFLTCMRINDLSQRAVTKLFGVGGLGPPTSLTAQYYCDSEIHPIVLTSLTMCTLNVEVIHSKYEVVFLDIPTNFKEKYE